MGCGPAAAGNLGAACLADFHRAGRAEDDLGRDELAAALAGSDGLKDCALAGDPPDFTLGHALLTRSWGGVVPRPRTRARYGPW